MSEVFTLNELWPLERQGTSAKHLDQSLMLIRTEDYGLTRIVA